MVTLTGHITNRLLLGIGQGSTDRQSPEPLPIDGKTPVSHPTTPEQDNWRAVREQMGGPWKSKDTKSPQESSGSN